MAPHNCSSRPDGSGDLFFHRCGRPHVGILLVQLWGKFHTELKNANPPHPDVFLPPVVILSLQNDALTPIHSCFSVHKQCWMLHHSSRNQYSSSSSSSYQHFRVLSWCWRSCCHRTLSCSHITCSVVQLTSPMMNLSSFDCCNTAQPTSASSRSSP